MQELAEKMDNDMGGHGRPWEERKERSIMDYKSIQYLKPLVGDKSVFRQ